MLTRKRLGLAAIAVLGLLSAPFAAAETLVVGKSLATAIRPTISRGRRSA
jgi:hypothetical protein